MKHTHVIRYKQSWFLKRDIYIVTEIVPHNDTHGPVGTYYETPKSKHKTLTEASEAIEKWRINE